MKKKYLLILLAVLFLIMSASCGKIPPEAPAAEAAPPQETKPAEEAEKTESYVDPNAIRIGVSMQGLQREYIQRVRDVMLREEERYKGQIELVILDGQEDAERQNAQIERLITQNVDAIIFNPISYDEGVVGVRLANEKQIPIVMLITTVGGEAESAQAYAVSDHKESAYIQMDMVADYLDQQGNIAILKGKKGIESEIARTAGYEEKLLDYPGIHVECSQVANWSTDEAREIVENWIRNEKDIDAILAQNDIMAVGALEAVKEAGKLGEIAVFGIDGDTEALQLVKKGELQGTVYHDAFTQGKKAVEYAVRLARGEKVEWKYIPFQKVDATNVDYYLSLAA